MKKTLLFLLSNMLLNYPGAAERLSHGKISHVGFFFGFFLIFEVQVKQNL